MIDDRELDASPPTVHELVSVLVLQNKGQHPSVTTVYHVLAEADAADGTA
jgi:hypothetical protein